jgi:hypothetical protein
MLFDHGWREPSLRRAVCQITIDKCAEMPI